MYDLKQSDTLEICSQEGKECIIFYSKEMLAIDQKIQNQTENKIEFKYLSPSLVVKSIIIKRYWMHFLHQ